LILEISSADETITVEVTSVGGKRKIRLGDSDLSCDWIKIGDGYYSLILNGQVFDLLIDCRAESCAVTSRAGAYNFRIADPRRSFIKPAVDETQAGLQRICADMPGKVLRVMVKEGDFVANDQCLLVLEAMKMQNEIRAPKSGLVLEVGITAGMTVNTGDFLLSLE
jgi:biotin carboxyl carrier protein